MRERPGRPESTKQWGIQAAAALAVHGGGKPAAVHCRPADALCSVQHDAPAGPGAGASHTVLFLQSFSTSCPLASSCRLTGAQALVTLLVHSVLPPAPASMMLSVPLGPMTRLQGPTLALLEVLLLQVTLPLASVTTSVQLSSSRA